MKLATREPRSKVLTITSFYCTSLTMGKPSSQYSKSSKHDDKSVLASHSGPESTNHAPEGSQASLDGAHKGSPTNPQEGDNDKAFFDGALNESTRPISFFTGEAGEYQSLTQFRGAARASSRLIAIDASVFETNFLHKPEKALFGDRMLKNAQKRYTEALKKGKVDTEAALGPIICQTLSQLSCTVAQKVKGECKGLFQTNCLSSFLF